VHDRQVFNSGKQMGKKRLRDDLAMKLRSLLRRWATIGLPKKVPWHCFVTSTRLAGNALSGKLHLI
jgi:hypothetical protein